jgi:hypothetical protein
MSDNDWSYGYTVYRFAFEIAKAEGNTLASMQRSQYLELIRDVVKALGDSPREGISAKLSAS